VQVLRAGYDPAMDRSEFDTAPTRILMHDAKVRAELEAKADIRITCLDGSEIARTTGAVHCLTRPIYR